MIDKFPSFRKLKIHHHKLINRFISQFPPYSDFNFTSLWTYNTDDAIEVCFLNNNLVVRFTDYLDRKQFYSFIGDNKVIDTAMQLIDAADKKNISRKLKLIPELVVKADKNIERLFKIVEDRDNHDYVISTNEVARLHPSKYKRKKYQVERFKKKYPNYSIKRLNLKDRKVQKQILKLFFLWEKNSQRSRTETANELNAIKRLFDLLSYQPIYCLGVYLENRLVGFNTYELTHDSYGISSFQKADKTFTYIYSILTYEMVKHLMELNCNFINFEQDLGFEGLRLSKSLWKPVHFLKKYQIALR